MTCIFRCPRCRKLIPVKKEDCDISQLIINDYYKLEYKLKIAFVLCKSCNNYVYVSNNKKLYKDHAKKVKKFIEQDYKYDYSHR